MEYLEVLNKGSLELGIELNAQQKKQFAIYLKQLLFFNKKVNLTSITNTLEVVKKHFLDSLSLLSTKYMAQDLSVVDIGAGAGFPGLPIKIVQPGIKMSLVEASRKKSLFLDHMAELFDLKQISIVNMRAEEFGKGSGREKFDIVVSRALSSLPVSLEYAIPLLKKEGFYLAMKGRLKNEPSTKKACEELGAALVETKQLNVPYLEEERNVVVFKKKIRTADKYPRRSGMPAKRPLI